MFHKRTICIPDISTIVETSTISYIYKCPICSKENRYAIPADSFAVFCVGTDFTVKKLIPIRQEDYIKQFVKDMSEIDKLNLKEGYHKNSLITYKDPILDDDGTDETQRIFNASISSLYNKKLIKLIVQTVDYYVYQPTKFGKRIVSELNKI